jgi:hypothetical protein
MWDTILDLFFYLFEFLTHCTYILNFTYIGGCASSQGGLWNFVCIFMVCAVIEKCFWLYKSLPPLL